MNLEAMVEKAAWYRKSLKTFGRGKRWKIEATSRPEEEVLASLSFARGGTGEPLRVEIDGKMVKVVTSYRFPTGDPRDRSLFPFLTPEHLVVHARPEGLEALEKKLHEAGFVDQTVAPVQGSS